MRKSNLIVLFVLVILLGISTGFIVIDFGQLSVFMVSLIGLIYTYWMGGPGGNSGTGNG